MGATTKAVSCSPKARDHQDHRAVAPAEQAYAGPARHPPPNVLPLVRALPRGRAGSAGRPAISAKPGMEHPGQHRRPDHRAGAGKVRA